MKTYRNVEADGERRIALISNNQWVTLSAGIASLEGREKGMSPNGTQCSGTWMQGQPVQDVETGAWYPHARPSAVQ